MFRKLLLAVTTLVLVGCIGITGMQLVPLFSELEFAEIGDRFKMAERRYTVTANAEEGGKVEGVKDDYAKGEEVNLVATADEGYIFNGWYSNNGSCKSTSPNYIFNIEKSTEITARFVPKPEKMEGETAYVSDSYQDTTEDKISDIDLAALETYLESEEANDFLASQIGDIVFGSPALAESIASANQALYDAALKNGYTIELISKENMRDRVSTSASAYIETIDGTTKHIVIDITVACTTPINDRSGKKLADFELLFIVSENINLTPIISEVFNSESYNVGIGIGVTESTDVHFEFNYAGANTLGTLEDGFNANIKNAVIGGGIYDKIKDAFESSDASSAVNSTIRISNKPINVNVKDGVVMQFDLAFVMNLNVGAALDYSAVCDQYFEIGLRNGSDGPVYYEKKIATAECPELTVNGKANTRFGITADFTFAFANGDTVSFGTSVGSYADIAGYAKLGTGYAAAYLELGTYQDLVTSYNIFGFETAANGNSSETAVFTFGYKDAVIGYMNTAELEKSQGFTIINEETPLADIPFLALAKLDIDTLEIIKETLNPNSPHYEIEITLQEGSNLIFEGGMLKIKDGAPAYFKETISVKIKPVSSKWSRFDDAKMYVNVPAITVPLTFGDLDSYYDSIDTNVEKQFRRIYRSYNKANADALIEGFEELIESFIEIPADKEALYHDFTASYLSNLFSYIEESKAIEDEKRTEENKFVKNEAGIFDDAITLVFDIMDGRVLADDTGRERVYTLLTDAENTVALYNTLIEVKDNTELKTQISANINNSTKNIIEEEITKYELEKQDSDRALALADAARELFAFEEAAE